MFSGLVFPLTCFLASLFVSVVLVVFAVWRRLPFFADVTLSVWSVGIGGHQWVSAGIGGCRATNGCSSGERVAAGRRRRHHQTDFTPANGLLPSATQSSARYLLWSVVRRLQISPSLFSGLLHPFPSPLVPHLPVRSLCVHPCPYS